MCLIKTLQSVFQTGRTGKTTALYSMMMLCVSLMVSRFEQTGLSGAGVYNQTDGEEFILPLGRHTSVFQAEVYALLYCARLDNLVNRNNSSV